MKKAVILIGFSICISLSSILWFFLNLKSIFSEIHSLSSTIWFIINNSFLLISLVFFVYLFKIKKLTTIIEKCIKVIASSNLIILYSIFGLPSLKLLDIPNLNISNSFIDGVFVVVIIIVRIVFTLLILFEIIFCIFALTHKNIEKDKNNIISLEKKYNIFIYLLVLIPLVFSILELFNSKYFFLEVLFLLPFLIPNLIYFFWYKYNWGKVEIGSNENVYFHTFLWINFIYLFSIIYTFLFIGRFIPLSIFLSII
jgi:hypothetical protein